MKIELNKEQINTLSIMLNKQYCPSCLNLPELGYNSAEFKCNVSCRKCWKNALKSLEVKDREE